VRINNKRSINAFNQWNQASGCDRIHFALAPRHPDSDFASDFSVAGLHLRILRANSLGVSGNSAAGAKCESIGGLKLRLLGRDTLTEYAWADHPAPLMDSDQSALISFRAKQLL
jgi:hypothetical protein